MSARCPCRILGDAYSVLSGNLLFFFKAFMRIKDLKVTQDKLNVYTVKATKITVWWQPLNSQWNHSIFSNITTDFAQWSHRQTPHIFNSCLLILQVTWILYIGTYFVSLYHFPARPHSVLLSRSFLALSVDNTSQSGIQTECKSGETQFVAGGSRFFAALTHLVHTFGAEMLCIFFIFMKDFYILQVAPVHSLFLIWR